MVVGHGEPGLVFARLYGALRGQCGACGVALDRHPYVMKITVYRGNLFPSSGE